MPSTPVSPARREKAWGWEPQAGLFSLCSCQLVQFLAPDFASVLRCLHQQPQWWDLSHSCFASRHQAKGNCWPWGGLLTGRNTAEIFSCPRWNLSGSFPWSHYDWRASQVVLVVKNLPTNAGDLREMWVRSPGREDPLEDEMASHSRILAWRLPMFRGAWWATVHRVTKSQTRLSGRAHTAEMAVSSPLCRRGMSSYSANTYLKRLLSSPCWLRRRTS